MREEHKVGDIQIVREDDAKKENELIKQGFGKIEPEDETREIQIVKCKANDEDSSEYYFEESSFDDEEQEETSELEKEQAEETVSVRRGAEDQGSMSVPAFVDYVRKAVAEELAQ